MLTPIVLTPADIEALIISEDYHRFPGTTVMTCCLKIKGWDGKDIGVTGESAVIDPEKFVEETGKTVARRRAVDKLWELEGYHLKRLHALQFEINERRIS